MIETAFTILLFVFGTFIGSYINVVGTRYSREDGFGKSNFGRSRCPHCSKQLTWFELIPIISFVLQGARCRGCREKLSLGYPFVEIVAGLIFAFVPWVLGYSVPSLIWIAIFLIFLLISIIDFRLRIIPDKLNLLIVVFGVLLIVFRYVSGEYGTGLTVEGTFLGSYALIFWFWGQNIFINHLVGTLSAATFFWLIYFISRGRAMGFGDVKLATAVGVLMGWPDAALALVFAFVLGGAAGALLLITNKKDMKDAVPFGPYIVAGVALVFFFGHDIISGYITLFDLH